jgi:TetR/AcrR family transcriptional regulator, mexJK operon transcriptional repressor
MPVSARQAGKREQIRTAAAGLFLAHGFAGTSMDAVTSAAGISKETLYRYYESKAVLFADVLGQLIAEPPRPSPGPPVVRTRGDLEAVLIRGSQRYLARVMEPAQLALLRIVIAEGSHFPELVHAFRGTLPATGGAVILDALEAGSSAGLVASSVDLRTAARAFAGLLMMFILRDGLLVPEPQPPERTQIAPMVRIFLDGIAKGPAAA